MLQLNFDSHRQSARRSFLQAGTLGALGLSLTDLVRAEAKANDEPTRKARAKSVILVFLGGGLSHHDSFDLKPDAPADVRGPYSSIPTCLPGVVIGELLPRMARTLDKVCLVRSGAHNNDHHETATNWVLSGRFGTPFGDFPAIGAVTSHQLGFRGSVPPYVAIPRNPSFTWELGKSAFLGGRYESFKAGDPNQADYRVRDLAQSQPLVDSRTQRRRSMLAAVDQLAQRVEANDQIKAYDEFQLRASQMVLSSEARDAFAIDRESPELRDAYGRNTFGQSCLLARRLVEGGVRFVTVNYGGWDHHSKIFPSLDNKLPEFDRGFSQLILDLHERRLLDDTLVVAMGEFGRTPKINKDAGRDHWGPAASLLFAGAGVVPGRVLGATDRDGAQVTDLPIRPADVAFTILSSLGIDPRRHLHSPDGRPIAILDQGEFIRPLFANV